MTFQEFSRHMQRLVAQFGKNTYSDERIKIIYRELEPFDIDWWGRTVDRFLGESRLAPLMTEIRAEISLERERRNSIQKAQHREDDRTFRSSLGPADVGMICRAIMNRIRGEMDDNAFTSFTRTLGAAPGSMAVCRLCSDHGVITRHHRETRTPYAFRCPCIKGRSDPRKIPLWDPGQSGEYLA